MFSKKVKYKVQVLIRVESIEQIPSSYVNGGGIKITYAKGKNAAHKGETSPAPCTSHTVELNERLAWKTKLLRDEKTGVFESKTIVFKLKHISVDGHKVHTLGTAEVDLALLCANPITSTRLAIQFAAKHQGRLKTKSTLTFEVKWLKVADKRFEHVKPSNAGAEGTDASNPSGLQSIDSSGVGGMGGVGSNSLMTTPYFGEDATLSEISEEGSSSSKADSGSESTNIVFESADLDETTGGLITSSYSSVGGLPYNPQTSQQQQQSSQLPQHSPRVTPTSSTTTSESLGNGGGGGGAAADSNPAGPNSSTPSIEVSSHDSSSGTRHVAFDPAPTTKTMRMRKQNSHGEVRSAELRQQARSTVDLSSLQRNSMSTDPRVFSASVSVLPEYDLDSSTGQSSANGAAQTNLSALPPQGASDGGGGLLSHVRARGRSVAAAFMNAKANITNSAPPVMSGAGAPVEPVSAPFVSYVDKDGPELPQSAQSSLVYLAPNAFAIQSAAVSGDEVARLRAETLDKNFKISLLGKQVEVLEKKLAEASGKLVEGQKRESTQLSEIGALEKKLRRARRHTKVSTEESTIDDESTTSSGGTGDQSRGSSNSTSQEGGTGGKKKRKRRARSDTATARSPLPRQLWTPERERVGLLTIFSIAILIIVILCSPQVRSWLFFLTGLDGIFGSSAVAVVGDPSDPSPAMIEAGNALSEAFANALNMSIKNAEA